VGLLAFHAMAFRQETSNIKKHFIQKCFPSVSLLNISPTETSFKFIPSPRNMYINTSRHTHVYVLLKCSFRSHVVLFPPVCSPKPCIHPSSAHVCQMTRNASYTYHKMSLYYLSHSSDYRTRLQLDIHST